jgi:formylglycine-generating enzyme required for sulfatase activity
MGRVAFLAAELALMCAVMTERAAIAAMPKEFTVNIIGASGITLKLIPPGTFMMGSPESEQGRQNDEVQHQVTLTKPFYLGTHEITQEQYQATMGTNPSHFKGDKRPVEQVSWDEAVNFCLTLSEKTGKKFRLPTEAEWEYARRAGGSSEGSQGNYNSQETRNVGSYPPNAWGLYDMVGNVWEWCADWYGDYPTGPVSDPTGPSGGSSRVLRGGSWSDDATFCRSASRSGFDSDVRSDDIGFRVALDP